MVRKLRTDEQALWARVAATVRPMLGATPPAAPAPLAETRPRAPIAPHPKPVPHPVAAPIAAVHRAQTLDGSWDRRLSRGAVRPDLMIDLHGRNLGDAYAILDQRLEQAIAQGQRVVLLVTGKPPRGDARPILRGAIRAAVEDWLAASRHAPAIAAVRNAHPSHGGAGALYIILRSRAARHRQKS